MRPRTIGISADSLWLGCAYASGRIGDSIVESQPLGGHGKIPSAILLPRIEGESFRFDFGNVPHPRGSGVQWPTEARVDAINGAGRLPVGLILDRIGNGNAVTWRPDDAVLQYSCSDAFAGSLAQLYPGFDGSLILVVPNHWKVSQQQAVLDSFQRENIKCKLLWRPIAAAIEWSNEFLTRVEELELQGSDTVGKLLSIYVGYGDIEITELELVRWTSPTGKQSVVPGRRRPSKDERLSGFGFRQLITRLSMENPSLRNPLLDASDRVGCIWNQLWCTQNLDRYLSNFRFTRTVSARVDPELERAICSRPQVDPFDLTSKLLQLRKQIQRQYSGIIISGPIASSRLDDETPISDMLLDSLDTGSGMTLVEGRDTPNGVLERGAYRFAERLERGLSTYLDTLPRLEMVILEKGEPTWIDLLEPEQKWVEGGKEWRRPERVGSMSIAPGSIDLKLAIAHEDFDHVREVVTKLPSTSITTERVSLSVQMTPAQGNARIEIHPANQKLFGSQRVFIDWKHMTDFLVDAKPTNKEGYLNSYERSFPELLPRYKSFTKIRPVQTVLQELKVLMAHSGDSESANLRLRMARSLLREKDSSMFPRDATAFDSNGDCASKFNLVDFMSIAWPYFQNFKPSEFIRAIAYTHVDYRPLQELLVSNLEAWEPLDDHVLAAGKCLRSPADIAAFVQSFTRACSRGKDTRTWWRALSELLRFRGDALQAVSTEQCMRVMERAGKVFAYERRCGNGGETFRLACLVIVYSLRRRAFDESFLDPSCQLAEWIKGEFRQARVDAIEKRIRLMKGSIDLSAQLQLIIDYVDRKGKGQLLIGE